MLYVARVLFVAITPFLYMSSVAAQSGATTPPTPAALGERCRQQALALDSVSRYQDRTLCTTILYAGEVYFASQYILASQNASAKPLIAKAIIQIKFAIDIGCYGQAALTDLVSDLQTIEGFL